MIYRVLALDPGGTTGWATFTASRVWDESNDAFYYTDMKFNSGQIGPQEHHLTLYNFLGDQQVSVFTVVCERFEYRNMSRPGLDLSPREYIGVAKLFYQERMERMPENSANQKLVFQSASQAKGFVADRNIKRLSLWSPGNRHAMDAYRHLLYYLINSSNDEWLAKCLLEKGWK